MSRKRCCCGGAPPGPYPCQPCPSPRVTWSVNLLVEDIILDAAGDGTIHGTLDFYYPPCAFAGTCGRQRYRRKAVGNQDFMPICDDVVCEAIKDEPAPYYAAELSATWTWCPGTDRPLCDGVFISAEGADCSPDVLFDYEGPVSGFTVQPNAHWNFSSTSCNSDIPEENTDCCTLITVSFSYFDEFTFPRVVDSPTNPGECFVYPNGGYISVGGQWDCVYGRRVVPGQLYAEGAYVLLRCNYPAAVETYKTVDPSIRCGIAGGTVCATDWDTAALVPTLWKPPANIYLNRVP